jgi:radical SAM C-methyltransferase
MEEHSGNGVTNRVRVLLTQQGVWDMPLESMPLAAGYMKASALRDARIREEMDIEIHNFRGGVTNAQMANAMFSGGPPDVLAFSVMGWNYPAFGALAATFKELNPDGWAIFGGPHVSWQAERTFRLHPDVDIVVNGEGELTFRELLRARLDGLGRDGLEEIQGISFRGPGGELVTTAARERIEDLDSIPSPVLTGALELTDAAGNFRYDVALMETNRGCPYKCSFCYWGGAVGQKVRAFSIDRMRQELEVFARHRVHTVVACDANFGLLPQDAEFVETLIRTRDRFGFPRALETSWAKNKSKSFYRIVEMMKDAGMRSSFTLALQTLSDDALETMNRRNMKVNEWEDLVTWLDSKGLECYAELIWGAPGETVKSFMHGYDRLSRWVSRIAVYPILLLPNTDYSSKKELFGIKSVRGDHDDFEYVLAHNTMTFSENQLMQRFLFWARVVAENAVLRHVWLPLRQFAAITQSQVLNNLDEWIASVDDSAAPYLRDLARAAAGGTTAYGAAISFLFTDPEARRLLRRWWAESVRPLVPAQAAPLLDEVFRYDLLTQPVYQPDQAGAADALPVVDISGEEFYLRRDVRLEYDVPSILAALRAGTVPALTPSPRTIDLYYRVGSESAVTSTNHEVVMHFMAMTEAEVLANASRGPATGHDGAHDRAHDGAHDKARDRAWLPTARPPVPYFPYQPTSLLNPSGSAAPLRRFVYPDGHLGWVTGSYEIARAILGDSRFSARAELKRVPVHRPGANPFIGEKALPGWFIDMDPPEHTKYRRLLTGYFTQHAMKRLRPRVEEIVQAHLTDMERLGPPADLISTFALPTALQALCEMLGMPYAERERIRLHRETLFSLDASPDDGARAMDELTNFLLEVIDKKKAGADEDLLGGLACSGVLDPVELAGIGVLLLTAGHDTVASMLGLGTLALLLNPAERSRADWEEAAVDGTVDELLRYLSIFHLGVPRTPLEDVELAGHVIKAGECVTVAIPAANQDPTRFTDSGVFSVSRAEGGHLAFGHGVHQCIGQNLARLEMRVGYPALFRRFPRLRLAVEPEDITVIKDGAIYALGELPVAW